MGLSMCASGIWGRKLLLLVVLFMASCSRDEKTEAPAEVENESADVAYTTMVETEEIISELVTPINRLSRAVRNLDLSWNASIFKLGAVVMDLDRSVRLSTDQAPEIRHYKWLGKAQSEELENLEGGLWSMLWAEVHAFEDARFGVLRGEMGEQPSTFITAAEKLGN